MKIKYFIELKNGYRPICEIEEENEISFVIEAPNMVTGDRMVAAMLNDAPNVIAYERVCIKEEIA